MINCNILCLVVFFKLNHVANVSLISNTNQTHTVCDEAKMTNRNFPSLTNLAYFLYHFISSHSANFNKIYYFLHRENKA